MKALLIALPALIFTTTSAAAAAPVSWNSNDTYWCSMYGTYVSYRSSHVRLGKTVCNAGGANNQHIGGGIGQWYIQTRSSGTFSCGLPYIGGINIDRWMDTLWRADGAAYF